ncbi:hypothetical protein [Rhizobium sp. 42MFCr.1]|jgi:hypothetical protein|uniref:hypothetical protein n=1 Tax=Rhizobium sp. 42MFCr.1 TaxID=1048680 RepID=UPI00036396B8|nr:hypothetical protein [Rhizobium sp. 42MFCr.1]
MNERMSKTRERAEAEFGLTQTQFLSRTDPKIDPVVRARNEKTAQLKAMRLQQEAATAAKTLKD